MPPIVCTPSPNLILANGGQGYLEVRASPKAILLGWELCTLTVTAFVTEGVTQVAAYGASTLTLDDGTFFPNAGSGLLLQGTTYTKFSWTGRTGTQLTGASGHGTPAVGTSCTVIAGPLTSYNKDCMIRVSEPGTSHILYVWPGTIASTDWTGGVATVQIMMTGLPIAGGGQTALIEVIEIGNSTTGFRGEDTVVVDVYQPNYNITLLGFYIGGSPSAGGGFAPQYTPIFQVDITSAGHVLYGKTVAFAVMGGTGEKVYLAFRKPVSGNVFIGLINTYSTTFDEVGTWYIHFASGEINSDAGTTHNFPVVTVTFDTLVYAANLDRAYCAFTETLYIEHHATNPFPEVNSFSHVYQATNPCRWGTAHMFGSPTAYAFTGSLSSGSAAYDPQSGVFSFSGTGSWTIPNNFFCEAYYSGPPVDGSVYLTLQNLAPSMCADIQCSPSPLEMVYQIKVP